jgi:hypothetical protein
MFKITVEWNNANWSPPLLAEYIADWVRMGEGHLHPLDRPEISEVTITTQAPGSLVATTVTTIKGLTP